MTNLTQNPAMRENSTVCSKTAAPCIAIGIATAGRPAVLSDTLRCLEQQTLKPHRVIIAPVAPEDVESDVLDTLCYPADVITSVPGLTAQRNAIVAAMDDADILIFFDDDFFPEKHFLANTASLFRDHPDIVLATGTLIEDGIHGPGIPSERGKFLIENAAPPPSTDPSPDPYYGVYGCNMIVRCDVLRASNDIRFDETLPLYAWQEDIDFSRQMAPFGRVVKTNCLTGVHLGTKRGRASGLKLGYSQVANPIYLIRKGTMSAGFGCKTMGKNVLANLVKSFRPEPHVDRYGRFIGNLKAFADLVRGRLHPQRILKM